MGEVKALFILRLPRRAQPVLSMPKGSARTGGCGRRESSATARAAARPWSAAEDDPEALSSC
jgi:hypothetical protein